MSKNVCVTVINKSPEGVLVRSMDGKLERRLTWEQFDKYFVKTDKPYVVKLVVPEEEEKSFNAQQIRYNWIVDRMGEILYAVNLINNSSTESIHGMMLLGRYSEEYATTFPNVSPLDFVEDFKAVKNSMGIFIE